ncbi:hypothetical protein ACRAWG_01575 [Methylobacterium sp. P31]
MNTTQGTLLNSVTLPDAATGCEKDLLSLNRALHAYDRASGIVPSGTALPRRSTGGFGGLGTRNGRPAETVASKITIFAAVRSGS